MLEPPVQEAHQFTVSGPNAAFAARKAFAAATDGWFPPSVSAEARLLVSELVGALVLQAETPTSIDVRLTRLGARGVRAELDFPRRAGQRSASGFRLLAGYRAQILDGMADRWGIVNSPRAPYVWFELGGR